jgi:hypothetical protein
MYAARWSVPGSRVTDGGTEASSPRAPDNGVPAAGETLHELERPVGRARRAHHFVERLEIARDHFIVVHFTVACLSAIETSIVSLWTSSPTDMLRFSKSYLLVCGKVRSVRHSA